MREDIFEWHIKVSTEYNYDDYALLSQPSLAACITVAISCETVKIDFE